MFCISISFKYLSGFRNRNHNIHLIPIKIRLPFHFFPFLTLLEIPLMISVLLPSTDRNLDLMALGVLPIKDFSLLARTSLLAAVAAAAAPPFIEPDISPLALVRSWCGWLTRSRLRSRAAALVAIVDANAAISMARNPGVVFACVGI